MRTLPPRSCDWDEFWSDIKRKVPGKLLAVESNGEPAVYVDIRDCYDDGHYCERVFVSVGTRQTTFMKPRTRRGLIRKLNKTIDRLAYEHGIQEGATS